MRPRTRAAIATALCALLGIPASGRGAEIADSSAWLPELVAESEAPDRWEEADRLEGLRVRADLRKGNLALRSAAAEGRWGRRNGLGVAWLARPDGRGRLFVGAALPGTARIGLGAFVARGGSPLFEDGLGLTRPIRAPGAVRAAGPRIEAPRGASIPMTRGAAAAVGSERLGLWALGGTQESGDRVVAIGVWGEGRLVRASLSTGVTGPIEGGSSTGRRVAALAARRETRDRALGGELLVSPTRGPELLLEVSGRAEGVRVASFWRRRPGEPRPIAALVRIETGSRRGTLRAAYRPWSERARVDDGRFELEAKGRLPGLVMCRARIGGSDVERHVVGDAVLAREKGRSFSLLLSRRESRGAGARAVGSMVGGRLELSSRSRAGLTVLAQATRSGSTLFVAPWSEGLTASGEETLVARNRSGLAISGRGWVRLGALRVEALASDVDPATGGRAADASLWLMWSRAAAP